MKARFDYAKVAPGVYKAMLGLEHYLHGCGLEPVLMDLIKLRALPTEMGWMHGANRLTTRSGNAPRWRGPRP